VLVEEQLCAIGEAVDVQMPDHMMPDAESDPTSGAVAAQGTLSCRSLISA
jgi:hypothetical protein